MPCECQRPCFHVITMVIHEAQTQKRLQILHTLASHWTKHCLASSTASLNKCSFIMNCVHTYMYLNLATTTRTCIMNGVDLYGAIFILIIKHAKPTSNLGRDMLECSNVDFWPTQNTVFNKSKRYEVNVGLP